MPNINEICRFLDDFAPTRLAEDWDNVGLLVGDRNTPADKIMTCLTVTPQSAGEAIEQGCQLIVSHHPLPFRPLKRLTTDTTPARLLWDLARAGVAIYSPHTGFDSAADGINQSLCQKLNLQNIKPLVPIVDDPDSLGAGRIGKLASPLKLGDFIDIIKREFEMKGMHVVGSVNKEISKVATACGSGGSFLAKAIQEKCDCFITGEATFHTCLESEANDIGLVLLGHYTSERFAVEMLAEKIQSAFKDATVWASSKESDPVVWV